MSLVKKIEHGKMIGKIFKVNEGYYFKIYTNKKHGRNKVVSQMFYYAPTEEQSERELYYAFEIMDEERFDKL